MISAVCSAAVSGAAGFVTFVVEPLIAHSRMTGVSSTDFFGSAAAARFDEPATARAAAPAEIRNSLRSTSAYLHRAVLVDGDRITRFDVVEELVPEQVDRDDAAAVPDVIHQQSGIRDGVDVL